MRSKCRRLSISNRIALIYSGILFCILIIFTILISYLLRNIYLTSNKEELLSAIATIENNVKSYDSNEFSEFENQNLGYNVIFNIYSEGGTLLYTNKPDFPHLDIPPKVEPLVINEYVINRDTLIVYLDKSTSVKDKVYYIQVAKSMGEVGVFAKTLLKILINTSLLGIIVCLISGLYLSTNVLKPIRNISNTAKELTSRSLNKRIPIDGPNDELKDLASTFNSMLERLETDFEKQRRFVYDASHELRTPLSVIYGNINMLDRWGKNDPQVMSKALTTLKSETENMNKLIENLLYLANSDNNALVFKKEEIRLNVLIKEVVDETQLIHGEYIISYICDSDYILTADYNAIKQVLRILMDNSIKFSTPPGNIAIKAEGKEKGTLITVEDKGCGIPGESLPYIFDRFYRVDQSRTKATGGTGLGLSIARHIVQSHNGTVSAQSKVGDGTKMEVYLPHK